MLDISAEQYHADKVGERPSLSASIIKILCDQSPLHAWTAHPRLNPNYEPWFEDYTDIGTIVHSLILQGTHNAEIIEFDDWRKKEAKELRAAARAAGKIPILKHKWDNVQAMVLAIHRQLKEHSASDCFTNGKPEQTLTFTEDDVFFKTRLDWLHASFNIDDLKTSGISANPEVFGKQLFANGLDIQAALYRKAVMRCHSVHSPAFRFVVVETEPPYALSIVKPDAGVLMLAEKKIEWAKGIWRECMRTGKWPGYSTKTESIELPEWEERRWLAKEEATL